jgi:hypothetical protein
VNYLNLCLGVVLGDAARNGRAGGLGIPHSINPAPFEGRDWR